MFTSIDEALLCARGSSGQHSTETTVHSSCPEGARVEEGANSRHTKGPKHSPHGVGVQEGGFEEVTIKLRPEASNFSERKERALPGWVWGYMQRP